MLDRPINHSQSTDPNTLSWRWYFLSMIASIFVAVDCAINAIYYLQIQGAWAFPVIIMAAIAGFVLNYLIYSGDSHAALRGFFADLGLVKKKAGAKDPSAGFSKTTKVAINLVALGSGALMFGFTMNSYLGLAANLAWINLQLALLFSIGYCIATFTLIRWYSYKSINDVKTDLPKLLLKREGSNDNEHQNQPKALKEHPWKAELWKKPSRWWRAFTTAGVWLTLQAATAFTIVTFSTGFHGWLAHLGLTGTAAWGVTGAVAALLALGELLFATNASLWLTGKIVQAVKWAEKKLESKSKTAEPMAESLKFKDKPQPQHSATTPWWKTLKTWAIAGMVFVAWGSLIILNSVGNAAIASPTSGPWIALLGAILSATVMAAAVSQINPKDLLPKSTLDKVKAISVTLVGLGCCAAFYFIANPLLLGLTIVAALATTVLFVKGLTAFTDIYGWGKTASPAAQDATKRLSPISPAPAATPALAERVAPSPAVVAVQQQQDDAVGSPETPAAFVGAPGGGSPD